jgi:hypothetical protein
MENRKILAFDEEKVIRKTQEAADGVIKRSGKMYLRTRPWRSIAY